MRKAILLLLVIPVLLAPCCGPGEEDRPIDEPGSVLKTGSVLTPDGLEVRFDVGGEGETALVFIHGWSCDRGYWSEQLPRFASDYRVVAIDLPGHGESGNLRGEWSLQGYGRDVAQVAGFLGLEKVVLIGHSMGGPVALEAAALMQGKVVAVIGVDTLQDVDFELDEEQWAGWIGSLEADFATACDDWVRKMFIEGADTALVDRVAGDMCGAEPAIPIALMKMYPHHDFCASLAGAGVPIRCINAQLWPVNFEGNRKCAPDFEVVTMEGVGHFLHMEKPQEFNEHLSALLLGLPAE